MNKENEQSQEPEEPKDQSPQEKAPEAKPEPKADKPVPETAKNKANAGQPSGKKEGATDQSNESEDKVRKDKGAKKGSRVKGAGKQDNGDSGDSSDSSDDPGFIEKVIAINRITKVTKGGKKMSFSALVVVGDASGNVGYSLSKAAEVATAIRKAMATAKKNMVRIPMRGTTIPHEIIGRCSGSRVLLKPASDGTGVIASGPVRAVCDGAGIHNILTKCHRSNNPINVVKATMDGLMRLKPLVEEPKEESHAAA